MSLFLLTKLGRTKSLGPVLAVLVIFLPAAFAGTPPPSPELSKVFPADLEDFHQSEPARQLFPANKEEVRVEFVWEFPVHAIFVAEAAYATPEGEKLRIFVTKYENDSTAYASFTFWRRYMHEGGQVTSAQVDDVGTVSSIISGQSLKLFKGAAIVTVITENSKSLDRVRALARLFARTLDQGEGDIPVLVKHLPNWETAQGDATYAVNRELLVKSISNQPILKEIDFEGGTEAVSANYGQSQLLIVEFTTPQFSVDNDRRILARIQELKSQGQAVPSAYRRVGNYSVFVFNAVDEKSANELIDQVKYEKVIQWLGEDPYLYERIQRYVAQTSAGVLVAVLKSSGLSLLICLGLGTLSGALLFRHRRAQQAALYSDAGGGVRLNLDELTGVSNSDRLLGAGTRSESDSTQS